jgi:glycosyltransferase involved in cell wall biosynthesis
LKILITADPFIPVPPIHYGGIERILDMIIREYIKLGHDVTLIAHPDSQPAEGCRFISYASDKDSILANSVLITKAYFKYRFDIIHSFSRLMYLLPLMPLSVPKIMSYQREPSLNQISKAVKLSKKGSIAFTGCSDYISNQIATVGDAYTVYNGVPINQFTFNANIEEDAPLVFLGRIEEIKGTHIAIEVANRTNKNLIIAGNIPAEHQGYFDLKVKPFLTDRIQYIGPVDDQQKNALLQNASAFLMPILWNEPFGIVMAEAMACGTPVIGFKRGSVPEVVSNNKTGYVCESIEDMCNAVENISNINREDVRNAAVVRFSEKVISQNYIDLYKKRIL